VGPVLVPARARGRRRSRRDERRVVGDEAEQRGAARVLPGEPEEVQAWDFADAAAMTQATVVAVIGRSIHEWSGR
jgi:hypothetical protein